MPRTDEHLFHKYQLGAVIEAQAKAAFAAIDVLPDGDILNLPKEELVERFARQFHLELPILAEDQRHLTNEEPRSRSTIPGIDATFARAATE